jgi:hypothetical protein
VTRRLSLEELFEQIVEVVLREFSDIVVDVQLRFTSSGSIERLRIFLKDESFADVWLSSSGKYSYHWEHRHISGLIHRHDNAPHSRWEKIKTFPKHFHDGSEDEVKESTISDNPTEAIREFLGFIRAKLETHG